MSKYDIPHDWAISRFRMGTEGKLLSEEGEVLGWLDADGYRRISARPYAKYVYAHQLVWFLNTGEWPAQSLDHINRNRDWNHPDNLREADASLQRENTITTELHTTGVVEIRPRSKGASVAAALERFSVVTGIG